MKEEEMLSHRAYREKREDSFRYREHKAHREEELL
jgi:hypothetical protein